MTVSQRAAESHWLHRDQTSKPSITSSDAISNYLTNRSNHLLLSQLIVWSMKHHNGHLSQKLNYDYLNVFFPPNYKLLAEAYTQYKVSLSSLHIGHTLTHTDTVSLTPWWKVSPVQSKLFTNRAIWSKGSKHADIFARNLRLHLVQASVNPLISREEK